MKYVSITMVMCLVLIGCTKEIIVEKEVIINRTINNTQYINITTIEPCNLTCQDCPPYSEYNRDYVLGLIRQLKKYEVRQDRCWNTSECYDDLNKSNFKLEECKEELCDNWNSSWCD